jgi:hypothetical protein
MSSARAPSRLKQIDGRSRTGNVNLLKLGGPTSASPDPPGVRLAARIATYSGVFALDLDQALPDAGRVFNGVSQRCLKLSGEVEALIRGDEVGAPSSR